VHALTIWIPVNCRAVKRDKHYSMHKH
jgi:hypothetical protein